MDTLTSNWCLLSSARVRRAWVIARTVALAINLALSMVACNQAAPTPPTALPITPTPPDQPTPLPITPTDTPVPFSVLIHDEDNAFAPIETGYGALIRLVQSQEDVQRFESLVDPDSVETLYGVDFEQFVVVLLFHGTRSSTGYDIELRSVSVREQDVFFDCRLIPPDPDEVMGAMFTSPYVAVTIRRSDVPSRMETLVMLDQGTEVARQTLK